MAQANVVLVGDPWLWDDGQRIAATASTRSRSPRLAEVRGRADTTPPAFLAVDTVEPAQVQRGQAEAPAAPRCCRC